MSKDELSKLYDVVKRIKCNDESATEIHFSCLDLDIKAKAKNKNYLVRALNDVRSFHCYLGVLSQAIIRNTVLNTVYIDPEFIHLISERSRLRFLHAIGTVPNLKKLIISSHKRQELPVSWLTTIAQSSFNLESMELHYSTLWGNERDFLCFSDALLLLSCTTLKSFRCLQLNSPESFNLDKILSKSVAAFKMTHQSSLEEIALVEAAHITASGACSGTPNDGFDTTVIHSIFQIPFLTRLSLNGLDLDSTKLDGIANLFMSPGKKLEYLNLSNSRICDDGCIMIANAVVQTSNHVLQELILANNNLGPKSGIAIGQLIQTSNSIRTVNLSNNNIGNVGIFKIAHALRSNTSLRTLHIGNCSFDDDGYKWMADALRKNQQLSKLNLSFNPVTDNTSYEALLDVMGQNLSMKQLILDSEAPEDLRDKINFYCTLNSLSIRHNLSQSNGLSRKQFIDLLVKRQHRRQEAVNFSAKSHTPKLSREGSVNKSILNLFRSLRLKVDTNNEKTYAGDDGFILSELFYLIRAKPEYVSLPINQTKGSENKTILEPISPQMATGNRKVDRGTILSARTA